MIHSCSLDTGMSSPSVMALFTFSTGGSFESALNHEWM